MGRCAPSSSFRATSARKPPSLPRSSIRRWRNSLEARRERSSSSLGGCSTSLPEIRFLSRAHSGTVQRHLGQALLVHVLGIGLGEVDEKSTDPLRHRLEKLFSLLGGRLGGLTRPGIA